MEIYEKIFVRMDELNISQLELSRRTGIATSTICDWKKKRINPQSDKLVSICKALEMSLVDLLCDEMSCTERRLLQYYELLSDRFDNRDYLSGSSNRRVSIITDEENNRIVLINDKKFRGLSKDDWAEVEHYLMQYVGKYYEIAFCAEKVFIDTDFCEKRVV